MTLLDHRSTRLGELRRSDDVLADVEELLARLDTDGYLFIPGFHRRESVLRARADLLDRLEAAGVVVRAGDDGDADGHGRALPGPELRGYVLDDVAAASGPLQDLLYTGRILDFYAALFGEDVRHFDFTWLRAYGRGNGTFPHMDSVFMNRGTPRLMTAWTPLGDIDTTMGGVTILAGSHLLDEVKEGYADRDVDSFCSNVPDNADAAARGEWLWDGGLSEEAIALCERSGLPWLTAEYRAGDLLTFPMFTAHAGLANTTDEVRLSCDSRYQRASEPADERWVGPNPGAHSVRSKVGRIC